MEFSGEVWYLGEIVCGVSGYNVTLIGFYLCGGMLGRLVMACGGLFWGWDCCGLVGGG